MLLRRIYSIPSTPHKPHVGSQQVRRRAGGFVRNALEALHVPVLKPEPGAGKEVAHGR